MKPRTYSNAAMTFIGDDGREHAVQLANTCIRAVPAESRPPLCAWWPAPAVAGRKSKKKARRQRRRARRDKRGW